MRRTILMFVTMLLAPLAAVSAQTVTTKDIVELSKAGLGEDVLMALIDVHRPVFPVDIITLKHLKDSGVKPNVIIAMIKSGRELPPTPPVDVAAESTAALPISSPPPAPQVIYIEHDRRAEPVSPVVRYEERVREVAVPVPVYIPVPSRRIHRPEPKPAEPVYWGFGGKLRPDAWKPASDVQTDARVPREPQKK